MLGLRKPHDLPLSLGTAMNDVITGASFGEHPEIQHHQEGFDFVPGNRMLSSIEVGLVNVLSRETVLRQYIDGIKNAYDYVLLDCRPSLGMLVINALSASDYVLIPVQADYLAAEDMTELIGTVQSIKRQINPELQVGGVFLTMVNETNFRKNTVAAVKENFGKYLPVMHMPNIPLAMAQLVHPTSWKSTAEPVYRKRMHRHCWQSTCKWPGLLCSNLCRRTICCFHPTALTP